MHACYQLVWCSTNTYTFFSWPRGKHSRHTSSSGCGSPSFHTVGTACGTCSAAYQNWRSPSSTRPPGRNKDRECKNTHCYSHIRTYKSSWIGCVQLKKWIIFTISYTWTHHCGFTSEERTLPRMRIQNFSLRNLGISRCSSPRQLC